LDCGTGMWIVRRKGVGGRGREGEGGGRRKDEKVEIQEVKKGINSKEEGEEEMEKSKYRK